jgi:hypothetical protein
MGNIRGGVPFCFFGGQTPADFVGTPFQKGAGIRKITH